MMNKIICIVGPTASNKTKLAIEIAKKFNGEVISADAFQVYKQLNAGVNKPSSKQLSETQFHLLNFLNLDEEWDIKKFQSMAKEIIIKMWSDNKLPIIAGGSHLYIDALIKNYSLDKASKRTNQYDNLSANELYDLLSSLDYDEALKIGNNNQKRLSRALEIITQTKQKKSLIDNDNNYIYDTLIIRCDDDRQKLYERINHRVECMITNNNWIDEVKNIIKEYPNYEKLNSFKAIGYKEISEVILNNQKVNASLIKQKTRNFAKRQITWSKNRYPNQIIFNQNNFDEIIKKIEDFLLN